MAVLAAFAFKEFERVTFQPGHKIGNRFKPGQSGNPSGKPKEVRELIELARSKSPEAVERICWLMHNAADENVQLAAANSLLDRAIGKPKITAEIDADFTTREQIDRTEDIQISIIAPLHDHEIAEQVRKSMPNAAISFAKTNPWPVDDPRHAAYDRKMYGESDG